MIDGTMKRKIGFCKFSYYSFLLGVVSISGNKAKRGADDPKFPTGKCILDNKHIGRTQVLSIRWRQAVYSPYCSEARSCHWRPGRKCENSLGYINQKSALQNRVATAVETMWLEKFQARYRKWMLLPLDNATISLDGERRESRLSLPSVAAGLCSALRLRLSVRV